MIELCREIIWQQSYEIQMMNSVINKLPNKLDYLQNNNLENNNLKNNKKIIILSKIIQIQLN